MNNHYHLLLETSDGNLSQGMRQLNGVYTQAFNRHRGRVGHLFQAGSRRFGSERQPFLAVCRYVVLNPVRAKSVKASSTMAMEQLQSHSGTGSSP